MLDSKFWARYFKVYDVLNLLIPYQELLETICNELEIKPGEKILEAGCGTGNLALKIKERRAEVVGLDNCKEALDIYQKKDPTAKIVLADLREKLPFPDNYFDKIASNNTLYIIPKEKQLDTLKELYRILKPNGKIVIVNPKKGGQPIKIYLTGIKQSFKKNGWLKTIKDIISMIIPTIKMLYYNQLIKKESEKGSYHFFEFNEQKELLEKAEFKNISTRLVYADQNILTVGFK
jgi:ubiquinone/menaquinone biosynthesis C-methylase UbiE